MNELDANTLTVAELIAKLQIVPQDWKVWADGCDCTNPVKDVIQEDNGTILLTVII